MLRSKRQFRSRLALLATWILATVAANPATGQPNRQRLDHVASLDAVNLVTLVTRCGGAEPLEESLELIREHACSRRNSSAGEILAFEENRWFVYALADMSRGAATEDEGRSPQANRRVFLLKPSTLVVEDVVRSPSSELSNRGCCVAPRNHKSKLVGSASPQGTPKSSAKQCSQLTPRQRRSRGPPAMTGPRGSAWRSLPNRHRTKSGSSTYSISAETRDRTSRPIRRWPRMTRAWN